MISPNSAQDPVRRELIKEFYAKYLKKYKEYLPAKFGEFDTQEKSDAIKTLFDTRERVSENLSYRNQADTIDKIQLGVNFNRLSMHWFNLSTKLSKKNIPIFDISQTDDKYTRTLRDYYPDLSVSYNFLRLTQKVNYWFAPKIAFTNSRDFDEDNLVMNNIDAGSRIVEGKTFNDYTATSYYTVVADKKPTFSAELPLIIYFKDSKYGIDFAVNSEFRKGFDNVGGRIGIYIPIKSGEDMVTIEPVIKFKKLEQDISFKEKKVTFGINLSITLPNFIVGGKSK
jgi:hypothetical protein